MVLGEGMRRVKASRQVGGGCQAEARCSRECAGGESSAVVLADGHLR
jgi:hypothetical protein